MISQYDGRLGDHQIGWGAAIALSAGFHLAMFIFLFWILPALAAILPLLLEREPVEEKGEVVIVRLLEEVPPPPEVVTPKKFVQEPLESPPPPEQDVLNEILPPEENTPAPPPEITKTETPPPKVTPPKVEQPQPEAPRPKPTQTAAKNSGPQAISGLSEAAASRLLGQSLGYEPGQVVAGSGGLRRDEEMMQYLAVIRGKIRSAWTPTGQAASAKRQAHYELYIEANGRIARARMTQSSGNRDFDQSVERALKKASPFPPLPSVFGGQSAILDLSLSPEQMR